MIQIQAYNNPQLKQQVKPQLSYDVITQVANIEQMLQQDSAWSASTIFELLDAKQNHLLVVNDTNQQDANIVAYCLYSALFETAEVLRVGTHPSWQRKGIALSLLQALVTDLTSQKVENLLLEVRADNESAISLYKKLGFNQIDCRKGYYKVANTQDKTRNQDNVRNIDALIMQKLL